MYFIYPYFLWFLFFLIIPVIIHFFNFRRYKKIEFSNTYILRQIIQERQIKSKLKEYLILFSRLLALLFLILSFAQPVWNPNKNHSYDINHSDVVIYIDNSFSMENISKEGKLIDVMFFRIKDLLNHLPKNTRYYIITNDVFDNKKYTSSEVMEFMSKIKVNTTSVPLSVILKRIQTLSLKNPLIFFFSDAQKKFTDIANVSIYNDVSVFYFLLSPQMSANISLDSLWIDNPIVFPNHNQKLKIKMTNHSNDDVTDIPVKISLNNTQISILNVSVPAHKSMIYESQFLTQNKDIQQGKVFINDYPITFDDELYFSLNTNIRIRALLINGSDNPESSKYFRTFFNNDSVFIFSEQQEKQLNFSDIARQDVIVLNELSDFTSGLEEQLKIISSQGKCIIFIPKINLNQVIFPSFLNRFTIKTDTHQQKINDNLFRHPLLSPAFEKTNETFKMPVIKEHIVFSGITHFNPVIELNNGDPLLFHYFDKQQQYYIFTSVFDVSKNLLPLHSLFVPLMYQLCFTSIPPVPLYYYCDKNEIIKIPDKKFNSDNIPHIVSAENPQFQIIPGIKNDWNNSYIIIHQQKELLPGQYFLNINNQNIFSMSFNYNRNESDMQFYSEKEMQEILNQNHIKNFYINNVIQQSVVKIIQSDIQGTSLWKLCLFLSLLFFITESLLIRFLK